ncbi:acetyl-CoA carboxylase carboxyl transferase subunit alpha [Spongiactinospora sp. TRM90649]|uniref:acetyl-CoA carboxylase carboxyl transferase subunit alpha n=1 Tax=Spongiactinospora sp. TRM90649 TaxID=3031114 RepID=UPI0023F889BC|nr:acetyl-CoA carboxylase carboxyl transferase subunit alpha [Spongiactinospora sp. TRM90649]MDF5755374.1 acetyl-CoA carboxylase carboxyl transferase subunit alpha [Spongiactinospora sp. TRM90649]
MTDRTLIVDRREPDPESAPSAPNGADVSRPTPAQDPAAVPEPGAEPGAGPGAGAHPQWTSCERCRSLVYLPRLDRDLHVCPECGHHRRIGAKRRLRTLLDPGSFRPATAVRGGDPLGFSDSRPYPARLAQARRATSLADAACHGRGAIAGHEVVVLAMDFGFMGGSMGSAVGETVARAADDALATRTPLILVTCSGGARMQEGALSLMQMATTAQALLRLERAGVLRVCVLADPTFGGVTASFATLGDVLVAERGGLIGFAGPRVIAAATGRALPEGFQTAEYLLGKGLLDRVETRHSLRPLLARVLDLAAPRGPSPADGPGQVTASPSAGPVVTDPGLLTGGAGAWEIVRIARDIRRPTTLDYIRHMADDFVELHGDRCHGDDPAVVGGLCSIGGVRLVLIGHQKGHDTAELVARNFGMPHPWGYRKALRLMRLADRLGLPLVTLVDTQGAAPGVEAEARGQAWAIAETIAGMSDLRVPVVTAVTGEGGSGGAIALAVADRVLMMENACYSVISPESCSTILCGDPSQGPAMAEALRLTAPELLRLGVADAVIREPDGGAQADHAAAAAALKAALLAAIEQETGLAASGRTERRHDRFRRLGVVADG